MDKRRVADILGEIALYLELKERTFSRYVPMKMGQG